MTISKENSLIGRQTAQAKSSNHKFLEFLTLAHLKFVIAY